MAILTLVQGCSQRRQDEKGVRVTSGSDAVSPTDSLSLDTIKFQTRPGTVLLTGIQTVRLTPVYKVNLNRSDNSRFTGSTNFHYRYEESDRDAANNWNNNLMPGIEAVYGYNMVNVSHYDISTNRSKSLFENPVLINTLYYPSYSKDTLNSKPVKRDFFLLSVYNEDTNYDGFINKRDLRRLLLYDAGGQRKTTLVPENYSVFKSLYDPANDFMYVYAQLDENKNGKKEEGEPIHIFWIDLKAPQNTGRQY